MKLPKESILYKTMNYLFTGKNMKQILTLTTGDFPQPKDTTTVGVKTSSSRPAALTAMFHSSISAKVSNTGLLDIRPPSKYLSVELK